MNNNGRELDNIPHLKVPMKPFAEGRLVGLGGSATLVYLAICAEIEGGEWLARPTIATIASFAGISRRTAQRAVQLLEAKRIIEIASLGGQAGGNCGATVYRVAGTESPRCESCGQVMDEERVAPAPLNGGVRNDLY